MGSKEENTQALAKLIRLTERCQDRCICTPLEERCIEIRNIVQSSHFDRANIDEVATLLTELEECLNQRKMILAGVYLDHISVVIAGMRAEKGGNKKMGLLDRIKQKLSGNEEKSSQDLLNREQGDAEQKVFELQKKIAQLYETHTELTKQVEEKVRKCSGLKENDNLYKLTRQQALALYPKIKSVEQQLNMYTRALENNSRYQAMIETGKTSFELQKYMPALSRAEALMGMISSETQTVSEHMSDLSSGISQFEKEMEAATSGGAFATNEFDQMVMQEREAAKEAARSQTAAETAGQPAEAADAQVSADAEFARQFDRAMEAAREDAGHMMSTENVDEGSAGQAAPTEIIE